MPISKFSFHHIHRKNIKYYDDYLELELPVVGNRSDRVLHLKGQSHNDSWKIISKKRNNFDQHVHFPFPEHFLSYIYRKDNVVFPHLIMML